MNKILTCLLLFSISTIKAEIYLIGGTKINIPEPKGYTVLTKDMDAAYRFSKSMVDLQNELLAYYIVDTEVALAKTGEMPSMDRYFLLKVNNALKNSKVSLSDFNSVKKMIRTQNEEIFKSLEEDIQNLMKNTSDGINKEFDVDIAMKVSKMVPLDVHYETESAMSYSMYINLGVSAGGTSEELVIAASATFIHVSGKILFLYSYGAKEDLEWTRTAAKTWAEDSMKANVSKSISKPNTVYKQNSKLVTNSGYDWERLMNKSIIGVVGGLLILLFLFFKKKKRD